MLVISNKLVDIETGELVGFLYENGSGKLAVTKEKAIELGLDCAEFAEYMDCDIIEAVHWGNYYAVMENELYEMDDDEYCGRHYIEEGDNVAIYGHVFKKTHLVELNNPVIIRRMQRIEKGEVALW